MNLSHSAVALLSVVALLGSCRSVDKYRSTVAVATPGQLEGKNVIVLIDEEGGCADPVIARAAKIRLESMFQQLGTTVNDHEAVPALGVILSQLRTDPRAIRAELDQLGADEVFLVRIVDSGIEPRKRNWLEKLFSPKVNNEVVDLFHDSVASVAIEVIGVHTHDAQRDVSAFMFSQAGVSHEFEAMQAGLDALDKFINEIGGKLLPVRLPKTVDDAGPARTAVAHREANPVP